MTTAEASTVVNELVGERVHQLMWRAKMTQTQLAPRLGMTQSALSRKVRGDRAFGIDELMMLASVLGVSVAELLPEGELPTFDGPEGAPSRARTYDLRIKSPTNGLDSDVIVGNFGHCHDIDDEPLAVPA